MNAHLLGSTDNGENESCRGMKRPSYSGSNETGRNCCRCRRRHTKPAKSDYPNQFPAPLRYETNEYSVPMGYGHRKVLVKAFVWELVISFMSEVIAAREELLARGDDLDPLHYLSLLEQNPTRWTR